MCFCCSLYKFVLFLDEIYPDYIYEIVLSFAVYDMTLPCKSLALNLDICVIIAKFILLAKCITCFPNRFVILHEHLRL